MVVIDGIEKMKCIRSCERADSASSRDVVIERTPFATAVIDRQSDN